MNVFDKVRNVGIGNSGDITGIVVETSELVTIKADSNMSTVNTTIVTKLKVLTFPAMQVVSSTPDMWELNA